jgi:UDP-N-acetylmuramoyl-L-alanyl-D-glutamate--2,6-diaminopimelate ligase
MEQLLQRIKKVIPPSVFRTLQPAYHFLLAVYGAVRYNSPSRNIYMIGITGTKGKSSTAEILNTILEAAGHKTAMVNGIRFKVGDMSVPNTLKMTMPGRAIVQSYIRKAVDAGCEYFILEMTSEGAVQFRHKFMNLDAFIFTNISPEHIESHGSFENYLNAKLSIAHELKNSNKRKTLVIANQDDEHGKDFLSVIAMKHIGYSLSELADLQVKRDGLSFTWMGTQMSTPLMGTFNAYNILAVLTLAKELRIDPKIAAQALSTISPIRGRVEKVDAGQDFDVVVDYAHTADSLRQFYEAFEGKRKICVLGSCGGGRDTWKRPEMGHVADTHCDTIILTNEDPYDEDPQQIIDDVAKGIETHRPIIIMDRREAIARAIKEAHSGDAVLITGKGTDPYIMEANGKKTPWDDATVAKEELEKQQQAQ